MAGRGSRLRPHTLTVPKPLVPVVGKPLVQRIVEDLKSAYGGEIEEVAFIIGDFGEAVERDLLKVADSIGAKGSIYYQKQPLGTAHAILCAEDSLEGNLIVAFADTLFKADFQFDPEQDGYIWVQRVEDPSAFGVIVTDDNDVITEFVEKSPVFVSDLAIVGIYYFRDGENLKRELRYLLDNDIKDKGEYQLTNALENMRAKGLKFKPARIEEWLDCGNKDNMIATNHRMLEIKQEQEEYTAASAQVVNSVLIQPCYIGENAVIEDSVVGPHVSIGNNSTVRRSVIRDSIVQNETTVTDANLNGSMIGNKATYQGHPRDVSIGDFSSVTE